MINYPGFDPIIFSVGPFAVRWYGLMYVFGFISAWLLARQRAKQPGSNWKLIDVDDLIFFCAVGVILGGRIGWVLFYGIEDVLREPVRALRIWEGGMSFHGGLLGVMLAMALFAKRRGRKVGDVFDFTVPLPALGLLFGRIGNFINGELWGKPSDLPWAFVVDGVGRHPSQLYEALLEGLVLFVILWLYTAKPKPRWAPTGLWLTLYGAFRFLVELVRLPDENRGYLLWGWVTEGQILSAPMVAVGVIVLVWAYRRDAALGKIAEAAQ